MIYFSDYCTWTFILNMCPINYTSELSYCLKIKNNSFHAKWIYFFFWYTLTILNLSILFWIYNTRAADLGAEPLKTGKTATCSSVDMSDI